MTSQSLVGIADFSIPVPNYINTAGEWLLVGEFTMSTTANPEAMGDTSLLYPGEHPVEGVTVIFDETWAPIVPGMVFSSLEFLEATPPVIVSPPGDTVITVSNYYPFRFRVIATDIDEDEITLTAECDYDGYYFDEITTYPGYSEYEFRWTPPADCSPVVPVVFTAVDEFNLTSEVTVNINVDPVTISVTSDSTLPGYQASVDVYLVQNGSNSNVGGFDLTMLWDASAFTAEYVDFSPDFGEWEYLHANLAPFGPGSLKLVGLANLMGGGVPPMRMGVYWVARVYFQCSGNQDLQGNIFPISMPTDSISFNVLSDSSGYLVYHPHLNPGRIIFMDYGDVLIGDINLNQLPYEMGDAIAFIDHLIDPIEYPFNITQRYASDCNQDLIPETIADLIFMLNVINGGLVNTGQEDVSLPEIRLQIEESKGSLRFADNTAAGGMLIKLDLGGAELANIKSGDESVLHYAERDGVIIAVVYPKITNGAITGEIISFDLVSGDPRDISLESSEFSTPDGALIK